MFFWRVDFILYNLPKLYVFYILNDALYKALYLKNGQARVENLVAFAATFLLFL